MPFHPEPSKSLHKMNLVGESVALSNKEYFGIYECTLTNCRLELAQSKGAAVISRCTIQDSKVIAIRRQRDSDFYGARFNGCTFLGIYSGIDFGRLEREGAGDYAEFEKFGSAENCDFSQAILDGCRFFNVDISTLILPRWPHIVIPEPQRLANQIATMDWPGHLGKYLKICASQPSQMKATVLHIPSMIQLLRFSEDDAFEALERLDGIWM